MSDGLNISNLPGKIQEFVEAQKLDTDGDGKISRAELSKALANVNEAAASRGDAFVSNNVAMPPVTPTFVKNILNLLKQIEDIKTAKEEDAINFDKQIALAEDFLKELIKKGEIDENTKANVDAFLNELHKGGVGYKEKVGGRYDALDNAINNLSEAYSDPQRPTGLLYHNDKQAETLEKIEIFTKMQIEITSEIRDAIEQGEFEEVRHNCEHLLVLTHEFSAEMEAAMSELESFGLDVLKNATQNIPGRNIPEEMKSISNLADTIGNISKEIKADMAEFKKFAAFLEEQLAKIDDYINNGIQDQRELEQQFRIMDETLRSKVEEFAGRYDKVLNAFEKFDLDKNETLKDKAKEVDEYKGNATREFEYNSDKLEHVVLEMLKKVHDGNTQDLGKLTEVVINHLHETRLSNGEAMNTLIEKAMEFAQEAVDIYNNGGTSGISNMSASEQKSTIYYDLNGRVVQNPKPGQLYIHDGKKVIYQE